MGTFIALQSEGELVGKLSVGEDEAAGVDALSAVEGDPVNVDIHNAMVGEAERVGKLGAGEDANGTRKQRETDHSSKSGRKSILNVLYFLL